jgi:hypothetical protein
MRKKQRKGAVLALVVLVVLLISMTSLALIRVGTEARLRSVRSNFKTAARFAADAGVERVLYRMNQQLEAGTWALDDVPTYNSQLLTGSNADYTVTSTGDLGSGYEVTSEGHSGNQRKTVRATIGLTSPIADSFAVYAKSGIRMKNGSTVGGFNSADPSDTDVEVKIGTQSVDKGAIDLKNNAVIDADIIVGPDGNPSEIVNAGNNTEIHGDVFVMPVDPYMPTVSAPSYTASQGAIAGKHITLNASDSGKYTHINLANNGTLTITGDVTLHVTGNIKLNKDAKIEIKNNATLSLYFDSDIDAKNSAGLNNETHIPANLKLYGTGTHQKIDIKNASDLYGVVYAPTAEMTIHNGADAYGSFIVDDFELKNSGNIYYDEALKEVTEDDTLVRFTITRWEEL